MIAWGLNVKDKCVTNRIAWGLNSALVEELILLADNADTTYQINRNPETHNAHTAAFKKVAIEKFRKFLSAYIHILIANPLVPDTDIDAMGLPSRTRHVRLPLPVPTEAPACRIIVGQHHDVKIYAGSVGHGHPAESLRKKGYKGLVVRYRKEGETEWQEEFSTTLHVFLYFKEEDRGKLLELMAAWFNPRLQQGPMSRETTIMIN
jgi:hypothetical protein